MTTIQTLTALDEGKPPARPLSVAVLDWPEQATAADDLARAGHLRLLLVAPGVAPPVDWDLTSDWLRRPADPQDIYARIETIQRRAKPERVLRLDDDGLLWRGFDWVALAPVEVAMVDYLLQHRDRLVSREELESASWPEGDSPSPRALDTRVQRVRNRFAKLGLELAYVRQRGFLLTASDE